MSLLDIFTHLLNLVAPAMACAVVLPWAARWLFKSKAARTDVWTQSVVLWGVGIAVLLACLWGLGRDGKMVAYGALLITQASAQWLMVRGWRT